MDELNQEWAVQAPVLDGLVHLDEEKRPSEKSARVQSVFRASHYFSMAFELSWNVVKDYLESEGFEGVSSPRAAVKKGFEQGLIVDGHGWIKGLEDRKFTSLTYNEDIAVEVEGLVRTRYISLFHELLEEPVKRLP